MPISLYDLLYLSHNAFVAGSTVALGRGAHANLLQVRAQPSQQFIYSICFLACGGGLCIWTCRAAALLVLLLPTFCFPFHRLFLCKWWGGRWRHWILKDDTHKHKYLLFLVIYLIDCFEVSALTKLLYWKSITWGCAVLTLVQCCPLLLNLVNFTHVWNVSSHPLFSLTMFITSLYGLKRKTICCELFFNMLK